MEDCQSLRPQNLHHHDHEEGRAREPGGPWPHAGEKTYARPMTTKAVAPYGEWVSPVSASMLTAAARPLSFPTIVGDEIWWAEGRPAEGGRSTVRKSVV